IRAEPELFEQLLDAPSGALGDVGHVLGTGLGKLERHGLAGAPRTWRSTRSTPRLTRNNASSTNVARIRHVSDQVCIEKGLLQHERIAPNTFRRVVKAHELLKPDAEVQSKRRLAFAKAHANELWQADTMFG